MAPVGLPMLVGGKQYCFRLLLRLVQLQLFVVASSGVISTGGLALVILRSQWAFSDTFLAYLSIFHRALPLP